MIYNDEFLSTVAGLVLFVLLAAAVATDLRNHRIPNLMLLTAFSLALILQTMGGGIDGLIMAAGGFTVGLAMLLPLYVLGGMGAGDVKLLAAVGSFFGPWGAAVTGMATMMAGGVFAITVIFWHHVRPALESLAAQILSPADAGLRTASVLRSFGREDRVTYIPYAPAIAVGTVAALWYLEYLPDQFLGWR